MCENPFDQQMQPCCPLGIRQRRPSFCDTTRTSTTNPFPRRIPLKDARIERTWTYVLGHQFDDNMAHHLDGSAADAPVPYQRSPLRGRRRGFRHAQRRSDGLRIARGVRYEHRLRRGARLARLAVFHGRVDPGAALARATVGADHRTVKRQPGKAGLELEPAWTAPSARLRCSPIFLSSLRTRRC
jgi:hypothetical protein